MTSGSAPLRVLFVEDAFDQALIVKAFLGSAGKYAVTHSQDGDSGAALLREQKWDVFITDLNLPGTDGFQLIRTCRELHPHVPIMATTGYTASHYQEEAFRSGADDLMTKPLDKEEFLNRMDKLLAPREETSTPRRPDPLPGHRADAATQETSILAIGGLVGDAEMGCGGSLVEWVTLGRTVHIVPTCHDDQDDHEAGIEGARAAAAILGAHVIIDEAAMGDTSRRMGLVEELVGDLTPDVVYVPVMDDQHQARSEAFRLAKATAGNVPVVLGYQTATTGFKFRPSRFVDISKEMVLKTAALAAYHDAGVSRLDLRPRMAQTYARYWGRLNGFTEVEAFEVLKDG